LQEKRTTSIRRTARIPPKESIAAEAPRGSETEADYNEAVDNDNNHRLIQEIDDSRKLGITISIHQFHGKVGTRAIISAYPSFEHFLEIRPTQCVIERIQNQGSFIDAPTHNNCPPLCSSAKTPPPPPPRLEFTSDVYQSVLLDTLAIEKFRLGATSIVEDL